MVSWGKTGKFNFKYLRCQNQQKIDELLARALGTDAEKGAGTKQCARSNGGREIGPAKHYLGN